MVCSDCLPVIAYSDASHLDAYYNEEGALQRWLEINVAIDLMGLEGRSVHVGDSDKDDDFSTRSCDCCGSQLAGSRHHCVVLGESL